MHSKGFDNIPKSDYYVIQFSSIPITKLKLELIRKGRVVSKPYYVHFFVPSKLINHMSDFNKDALGEFVAECCNFILHCCKPEKTGEILRAINVTALRKNIIRRSKVLGKSQPTLSLFPDADSPPDWRSVFYPFPFHTPLFLYLCFYLFLSPWHHNATRWSS